MKTVGVLLPHGSLSYIYIRTLDGISSYSNLIGNWRIVTNVGSAFGRISKKQRLDGVIVHVQSDAILEKAKDLSDIIVNTSASRSNVRLPSVTSDNIAVGRLAADYFFNKGFQRFVYCHHNPSGLYSSDREHGFATRIKELGGTVYSLPEAVLQAGPDATAAWFRTLLLPIAVFASTDQAASQCFTWLKQANIAIPEEAAVLGVDNLLTVCSCLTPSLSSINPNHREIGFQAARLLDALMQANTMETEGLFIPPKGIVERKSTGTTAVEDPEVCTAMKFIRECACENIRVQDVLDITTISRRCLERRFKAALGRTVNEEIIRIRINRIKELAAEPGLRLLDIAEETGFQTIQHMAVLFKKKTGTSLSEFRKQATPTDNDFC